MKIMIVDDEVIIRTGLAQVIDWKELGLVLLEPAASGEEALARIPAERPNILLTDIRMSGLTGLELAEEAKRILPDLEIIILSGYDDFKYTQQAIRQGVSDFLLKTSRPEEIIRTVLQAKRRMELKWARQGQEYVKNKEARDRLFARWIVEGNMADRELMAATLPKVFREGASGSGDGEGVSYSVFLVQPEGWEPSSGTLLRFAVDNMLTELVFGETLIHQDRIIAAVRGGSAGRSLLPALTVFARIERLLKCTLTIAAGETADSPEGLYRSYVSADYALGYKGFIEERMLDYNSLRERRGGKKVCAREEELELTALLLGNDQVALNTWVQRFMQSRLEDPQMTLESLESSCHSAASLAQRWLQRVMAMTGRADAQAEAAAAGEPLPQVRNRPKEGLFRYLYAIMRLYHVNLAEGQSSYVMKAIAYIEEHLEGDVALQQVAKIIHVHPSHLSEVFKKETGQTFGDYVVRQKLERAKELLTASPAKISEIASKLGYEDVKYFGQLFKKATGKTPSEYRAEASIRGSRNN